MNRRTRRTLWVVAAVLLMLAVAIFLRSKAPPEAARLLPESDGIVYLNLKTVRDFSHLKELKPPDRSAEYQQFVDAIGFDWEQNLDEAAVALHRMPDPTGPNGPVAYSMVLVGKLTGQKLNGWLSAHAVSRETYAGNTVYSIPSEGRTVRVAQIGYDMVAISNTPTPEQIHSMLDRHRTAALPFSGSTLLSRHYNEVPLLSLAWGVGQIGLPFSESGAIKILGFTLPLEADSTIIASVRWAGALRMRVEEIAPSEAVAVRQAATLSSLVALAGGFTAPLADNAANNSLKELLKTAEVKQIRDRVVVTADLSPSLFSRSSTNEGSSPNPASEPGVGASK
jgi:hypothetical protein